MCSRDSIDRLFSEPVNNLCTVREGIFDVVTGGLVAALRSRGSWAFSAVATAGMSTLHFADCKMTF
jgi:hypothetical protein